MPYSILRGFSVAVRTELEPTAISLNKIIYHKPSKFK